MLIRSLHAALCGLRAFLGAPACPTCGTARSCGECLAWQAHK